MTTEPAPRNADDAIQKRCAARMVRLALPIDEIAARYIAGESEKGLADAFGVTRATIARRLRLASVERRTARESILLAYDRMPADERQRIAAAAHNAVRGMVRPLEEKCRRAQTRQERGLGVSPAERLLASWLADRGIIGTPQQAIGPYNADLGAFPVAVEIFGGGWHGYGRHKRRAAERYRYILDQGWTVVIVWVDQRSYPLGAGAADYVVALIEAANGDPSLRGQYRVIRGTGEPVPTLGNDLDELTVKPPLR